MEEGVDVDDTGIKDEESDAQVRSTTTGTAVLVAVVAGVAKVEPGLEKSDTR